MFARANAMLRSELESAAPMGCTMESPPRMTTVPPASRLHFGGFELDLSTGELRKDGVVVRLPPQPSKVLAVLAGRPGELVTREELRRHLWGETFVDFDRGLNFCINQVRAALG